MSQKKFVKIICIGIVALAFAATTLHAAPKKEKAGSGKAKANVHKPAKKNTPHKAAKFLRKNSRIARDRTIHREKNAAQTKALRPTVKRHQDRRVEHRLRRDERRIIRNLNRSLARLNSSKWSHAKWSHNPNDDRGQGNMGKVDMLDPFGHDKDSDRKELYGNRGRVLRTVEPEPEPPPPDPEPEPEPEPEPPPPEPEPEPNPDPIPEFPF